MMTELEFQEVVTQVVTLLKKDSLTIAQLDGTNVLSKNDYIELDGGRKVSLDDLRNFIKGYGVYWEVIGRNDNESIPSDYNVFSASRTLYEIVKNNELLKKVHLRKDKPDQTEFLLKLLGGAEFGEFVDSMIAGKGTGILPNGRLQTGRLEVRDGMTVMDLIINQIQGMEADYSFSEIGKINSVEYVGGNTYKLMIDKRTEFDFMKFHTNDVCFSIVNTLLTGGTDFYTSWMRVINTNVNDNSVTVVLYPDTEVPGGKNYPPVAGYNMTRRGNARLPEDGQTNERSQSWMLSSREGRIMFLANVYKPILEDYNYALTIGKMPHIKALEKLPIGPDEVGIVAQTVVAEKFWQFDYNGDVMANNVDRGEWSREIAASEKPYRNIQKKTPTPTGSTYTLLEQHTVYHYGSKWGCLIDKTLLEPKWNSPAWLLLEGNKNYLLSFSSNNGWSFHRSNVDLIVTAEIEYANRDITDEVMANPATEVEWLRDSGNVPSDNAWKPSYEDGNKGKIHLTLADMGSEWGLSIRKVSFICRVFIPEGDKKIKAENSINFKV